MPALSTTHIRSQKKLFHNESVNVYSTHLRLDQIHFWERNNRTIFTFERLEKIKKEKLKDISIEEITRFVAEQDIHKLQRLAGSVGRNGVQVPLIVRDDGKLLDGNRRFFACQWLKIEKQERNQPLPDVLNSIPVMIIRKADLTDTLELKILAEANFIPDLKVAWPLDAQARSVHDYYLKYKRQAKADHETVLAEIVSVFGIQRQRAVDLLESLELTKEFIRLGKSAALKTRRREIIEERFVYFWEFRNKATKGRWAYTDRNQLKDVKSLFFQLMAKGKDSPIKNVKQVEPLVQAKRDDTSWKMLKASKGSKLETVIAIINEKRAIRKSEDKIRMFLGWLKDEAESGLTKSAKALLKQLSKIASDKSK